MKTVYIFRGAPASGKGTLVPAFTKLLPRPAALIEQDAFRWGFHLIGRKVSEVEDSEHTFAYHNMLCIYEEYLKNGAYTITLEGLFSWDDMSTSQGCAKQLIELAHRYGFETKSIVLRANKDELLARNEAREYSVPRDEFDMLYDNIYKTIGDDEVVVDSTGLTADEALARLQAIM